jgi:minor extracellular serine protease Vpr
MEVRLRFAALRRRPFLLASLAALTAVPIASGSFQPIRHDFGELTVPRVRAGHVTVPSGHRSGRIRVIVSLGLPPLAQAYGRGLYAAGSAHRLNVRSAASKAYLRRIEAQQKTAIAQLKRALPSARVSWRYQVVLNGFAVSIPAKKLPQLSRQSFAARVWPSYTYHLALNRSPAVIGADVFHAATGANGEGVKIGVVDDGVDNTNPFLSGAGYTPPAGFPQGQTQFTNGKIIVARAYPGPGSGAQGKLALDRKSSFHGTHVAGIAAGNAGTTAPAGSDHPATSGLSGVAPKAFLGNYRVFNVPTPIGHIAESPEIAEAFEQTVKDGMDVINFSGGGPQAEPLNDVLIAATNNVAAAGVVPVLAAGNDRDDFGFGSAGSPGAAPDAISVAAVSNAQIFAPALSAFDASGKQILHGPIQSRGQTPAAWETTNQLLIDVGSIIGRNGQPVDRQLCGSAVDPNGADNPLPAGSLSGAIALVSRGSCTFVSKAGRAQQAGAIGIVLVDNRFGEANPIPIQLQIPSGMVADVDGAALRAATGTTGRIQIRIGRSYEDLATERSGIVTSFSSAGPTAFGHQLKPDVAAPGGQILSSTLPEFAGSPFAVFDGTSMATPHVTGAAALLVQRHPTWSAQQLKSALMSTSGPAWGNTARTKEAAVTLEGAGLINVARADNPQVFTDPASISLGELDITSGAVSRGTILQISDATGGAGIWSVALQPQSATNGTTISVPALVSLAPGGEASVPVSAHAAANAATGDDMGFVVLTKGAVSRRVPYYFEVAKPALANVPAVELGVLQSGDTITGQSLVSQYRFPSWPFGPAPNYGGGPAINESGAERLYTIRLSVPTINFGVAVLAQSANSEIDPFVLGSKDENDVQGYAGLPVNVNGLMYDYRADIQAAGAAFPLTKRYYVAVDSGSNSFTGQALPGRYVLRAWVDDLRPPSLKLVTTRLAAGRPTVVAIARDSQSGIDPLSLVLNYNNNILLGASAYDPGTGLVLFVIPSNAPAIKAAKTKKAAVLIASDNQEAKNVNTIGANVLPNTNYKSLKLAVGNTPTVAWLVPSRNACLRATTRLAVVAGSTKKLKTVTFYNGKRKIGSSKPDSAGIAFRDWNVKKVKKGKHALRAKVSDARGRTATASRIVRVCK